MRFRRIQHRTVLLFVLFAMGVLILGGWMLQWSIRQSLEAELGRKLVAVAQAVAVQYGDEEVSFLQRGLGPRAGQRLRRTLLDLRAQTGLRRIYLFDLDGRSLLDTDSAATGEQLHQLRFHQREIEALRGGEGVSTILFEDLDGNPAMTGFAPLFVGDDAVGGVAVEGSVTFLDAVDELRTRLLVIGLLGAVVAVLVGALLARTITRPVNDLIDASRAIGTGDYGEPIAVRSKDEIGTLAVTMEEMRESVLTRERELKAMLAGVAHEIRNPLGGIELFVGLLADDVAGNEEAQQRVERIGHEVGQLKELVESFLDYARPPTPAPETCRLDGIFEETLSLMGDGLEVHLDPPERDTPVIADPGHLKQIFLNLIRNAGQAQPDGGTLRIAWRAAGKDVLVTLADEGGGIPEDAAARIFEPFFTTRQAGTGLGLAIVRNLVEANAGGIRLVRSDAGGTVFDVTLPGSRG